MKRVGILAALGAVAALAACNLPIGFGCAGVGYYALRFDIRDVRGDSQALGTKVKLTDGSYQETAGTDWSPLTIYGAGDRGGRTYDVVVSKPHYNDVEIRNLRTRGGGCVTGHEDPPVTTNVNVTLTLASAAPAMRAVRLLPPQVLLDRAPYTTTFTPSIYVDANPGVSRALTWSIRGDTASVSLDAATGRITYRCLPTSGRLKLIATSVVDPTLSAEVDVAVQGHPGNTSDPPC